MERIKVTDLPIADLKAAHEFCKTFISDFEEKANGKVLNNEATKSLEEWKTLENKLYHQLLTKVSEIQ